ncbi:Micro-fibrillar-associated protein 1 [Cinnamomum micranthum f. kanehirae]|uniref:Micro-fibrillar-associated protein 1 n=1 Tax=Cinnamomum micranthum f. kanehirae TaxID=337451 RepID=A0A443NEE9_9MAGN|nr:Micro-fibrillar-associated protein 1 [Cinnamomum micranthum f. kanehirae]
MSVMIAIRGLMKVKRYWPGKSPEWADKDADEEDGDIRTALEKAFPSRDNVDVTRKDDPRLRRLAESNFDNKQEVRADHLRMRRAAAETTTTTTIYIEEEDNRWQERLQHLEEDDGEERRRIIRDGFLQRKHEEDDALLPEEEEESEYETDSEDEQQSIKPVFVPNSERDTIAERERLEAEAKALEESAKRRLEQRKLETKQILVEEIQKDEEIQKNWDAVEANAADVDTDDEANEAEEYEVGKSREIARIKRDREDRESMFKEKEGMKKVKISHRMLI